MSVLVTGASGFIGQHLAAALAEHDDVIASDFDSRGLTHIYALDVRNQRAVDEILDRRVSAVYHLAAVSSVAACERDPARAIATNVIGTTNVLASAQRYSIPVIIASTGGAMYQPLPGQRSRETDAAQPRSVYGVTKLAAEHAAELTTNMPVALMRLANVYGPGQPSDGEAGVVAILRAQLDEHPRRTIIDLRGYGDPTRDYLHVRDAVNGLMAAEGEHGVFNLGTGVATSVLDLFRLLGGDVADAHLQPLNQGELMHSCLDPSKALRVLGWRAPIDLELGVSLA